MNDEGNPEPDRIEDAPHPRNTPELFGQKVAEAAFLSAHQSGRLHHGWLITGPRGVGKATLAWRIARYLLAQPAGSMFDEPAPENLSMAIDHPVFRRIAALSEPGVFLCRRAWDEKLKRLKTQLTVDEVRKLKGFFAMSATDGGWRVAIVDAVDEMNTAASNALLKILEEPPARSIILLVCHQPAKLLPTIRSRCRELRLGTLTGEPLAKALVAAGVEADADPEALAALAGGSVGEAIRLITGDGPRLYGEILRLLDTAPRIDRGRILSLGAAASGRGSEAQYDLITRLLLLALARLARLGAGGPVGDLIPGEADLATRLAPTPAAARQWAQVMQEISARLSHARAVNLDPGQVILDMVLSIERTARQVSAPAL